MAIIANFTPDDICWTHQGVTGTVPAYKEDSKAHVVDMDDARGNHILNEFSRRGLVKMQFDDDPEVKKEQALAQYNKFWEYQIDKHNEDNEQQAERGHRYNKASTQLVAKADELGIPIKKPGSLEQKGNVQTAALLKENAALRETVEEQSRQMAEFLEMFKAERAPAPEAETKVVSLDQTVATNRRRYASLTQKTMSPWLINNWDEIQEMPEENRFEIQTKYEEIYQTPFPAENPA